jgi:hypothetical protein
VSLAPRTLVQRVVGVGLEEEVLQADHDGVEVEHGLPVLAQDVEAHVALEIDIGMVDLARATSALPWRETSGRAHLLKTLDLRRVVRVVVVDGKGEVEGARLVHACSER